ncbi:MAG: ribbon-helix-helix protein, CopG family [Mycobacterium sp.]
MLSFRADDSDVAAAEQWARRLDIDRSQFLRDALRRHVTALAADQDVQLYTDHPLTADEQSLAEIADWGPAEEWTDWDDAAR